MGCGCVSRWERPSGLHTNWELWVVGKLPVSGTGTTRWDKQYSLWRLGMWFELWTIQARKRLNGVRGNRAIINQRSHRNNAIPANLKKWPSKTNRSNKRQPFDPTCCISKMRVSNGITAAHYSGALHIITPIIFSVANFTVLSAAIILTRTSGVVPSTTPTMLWRMGASCRLLRSLYWRLRYTADFSSFADWCRSKEHEE